MVLHLSAFIGLYLPILLLCFSAYEPDFSTGDLYSNSRIKKKLTFLPTQINEV